jgi:hypothetical protein
MSQKLISRSPDLKKLRDDGYEIEIRHGHLLIHSIPYVNAERKVQMGTLVSDLSLAGDRTVTPHTHVIFFQGEYPCSNEGVPLEQIRHASEKKNIAGDIAIDHSFSNKPSGGYANYYEKITQYIKIISHPAEALDDNVDPRTFKPIETTSEESVFRYVDTASSRAGIQVVSDKVASQRIAIVGLGGTGSYVLDFVAKTPVREIHLFDGDDFQSHNAFRAPGAASLEDLCQRKMKVAYLADKYSRMHTGITAHPQMITKETVNDLQGFDYVFLCVDKGSCKKTVIDALSTSDTVVIDAGMDVQLVDETLLGTCRVTTCTKTKNDHAISRISMSDNMEDAEYSSNIQIVELNALNACHAVIKWKQLSGFYQDLEHEHHLIYSTNCALLDASECDHVNKQI